VQTGDVRKLAPSLRSLALESYALPANHPSLWAQKALYVVSPCSLLPGSLIPSQGGHSHRHSDMMIKLLPETAAKHDFEVGLVQRLLGFEPKAKTLQALSVYGCRHCTSAESESRKEKKIGPRKRRTSIKGKLSGSKDHTPHSDVKTHPTSKSPCDKYTGAFTFFGLRSHLYAK
jgi:hypothetical protein